MTLQGKSRCFNVGLCRCHADIGKYSFSERDIDTDKGNFFHSMSELLKTLIDRLSDIPTLTDINLLFYRGKRAWKL